jgi:hypothetical protein
MSAFNDSRDKPLSVPPAPTVSSKFEWDTSSEEAKARALYAWSEFWLNRGTPAVAPMSGVPIVIPLPSTDGDSASTAGWKQGPTAEERESMQDGNWKNY